MAPQVPKSPAKEHTRKLVTVRQIEGKTSHKGVWLIHLDGWMVSIPNKFTYEVGQYVVYFEIDSFLPASQGRYWEFMSIPKRLATLHGQKGYRVSSSRIAKQFVSQGLAFPLRDFPEIQAVLDDLIRKHGEDEAYKKIMDMSFEGILGIEKWVPEMDYSDRASIGKPPMCILQPGWQRCQNIRDLFKPKWCNAVYQITEKLDGLSMSVYLVRRDSKWFPTLTELPAGASAMVNEAGRVGVCSRDQDFLDNGENLFWETAKELGIPEKIVKIGGSVAVQGELVGWTVAGNTMGFAEGEHTFVVFSIFDIDAQRYWPTAKVENVCKQLGIVHTRVIGHKRLGDFAKDVSDLIKKSEGVGMKGRIREGLVFKTLDGQRQFKVISNSWLIQTGRY